MIGDIDLLKYPTIKNNEIRELCNNEIARILFILFLEKNIQNNAELISIAKNTLVTTLIRLVVK